MGTLVGELFSMRLPAGLVRLRDCASLGSMQPSRYEVVAARQYL
ncbi:hypothetical protein ACIBBB_06780 [Streptomyces sp. NPDC051217]